MPEWIHNRAEHLLAKNPSMAKGTAFAVATQQSHSMGKSPKGYGTAEGKREAKAKYDTPKGDEHAANPGGLESSKMGSLEEEIRSALGASSVSPLSRMKEHLKGEAIQASDAPTPSSYIRTKVLGNIPNPLFKKSAGLGSAALNTIKRVNPKSATELAGLGILAVPGIDEIQSHVRAHAAGDTSPGAVKKRRFMSDVGHAAADVGGLGVLMAPEFSHLLKHGGISPSAIKTLTGAGLGMAAGGAAGAAGADEGHKMRGALMGAAAGGGLGAAAGHAVPRVQAGMRSGMSLGGAAKAVGQDAVARGRAAVAPKAAPVSVPPIVDTKGLTAASGARSAEIYGKLPDHLRGALESSELVQSGVPGPMAAQLAYMSRKPGEGFRTSVARHAVGGGNTPSPSMVARADTPTRALTPTSAASPMATSPSVLRGAEKTVHETPVLKAASFASYSGYGGNQAQNPPGMRQASPAPGFTAPALAVKVSTESPEVTKIQGMLRRLEARRGEKIGGVGVGSSMTASQYSGPLSYGPFKQTSGIPPFTAPTLASKGEPDSGGVAGWMRGDNKVAASAAATGAMSPAGRLSTSQRTGAPKTTGFSGPSIADVSKPQGFGTPIAGALKNAL